jgi:hypothetical protein
MASNVFALKTVTVIGSATGNPDVAREQALANALREAVRAGAGVDILSESKINNFTLEYDRVITSSFGYVKEFEVKKQGYNATSQTYSVTVEAKVDKGRPLMDNIMALRLLVRRMKSPRVVVEVTEDISGISASSPPLAQTKLEELCQNIGLQVIKQKTVQNRSKRESLRAELLGEKVIAKAKKGGIQSTSDFKITGKVSGNVGKLREPFPGVEVRNASIGVDLQAVWTDTAEVAATLAIPTAFFKGESQMELPYDMPKQLIRHYLTVILEGKSKEFKKENALRFFDRIIAKWIVELDMGAKVQLEFRRINKNVFDNLLKALKKTSGITYAWRREFDSQFFSSIEIETRLDTQNIENVILKNLNGKYMLDTATKRRLTFIPKK